MRNSNSSVGKKKKETSEAFHLVYRRSIGAGASAAAGQPCVIQTVTRFRMHRRLLRPGAAIGREKNKRPRRQGKESVAPQLQRRRSATFVPFSHGGFRTTKSILLEAPNILYSFSSFHVDATCLITQVPALHART